MTDNPKKPRKNSQAWIYQRFVERLYPMYRISERILAIHFPEISTSTLPQKIIDTPQKTLDWAEFEYHFQYWAEPMIPTEAEKGFIQDNLRINHKVRWIGLPY